MQRLGRATQRQFLRSLSKALPLRLLHHLQPLTYHPTPTPIPIPTPTRLFLHRTVTRRVRPTCHMPMALIQCPTSRYPRQLVPVQKKVK